MKYKSKELFSYVFCVSCKLVVGLNDACSVDGILNQAVFGAPYRSRVPEAVVLRVAIVGLRLMKQMVGDVERDTPVGIDIERQPMDGLIGRLSE